MAIAMMGALSGSNSRGYGKGGGKGGGGGKGPSECFEFRQYGRCSWGDQCRYVHQKSRKRRSSSSSESEDDESEKESSGRKVIKHAKEKAADVTVRLPKEEVILLKKMEGNGKDATPAFYPLAVPMAFKNDVSNLLRPFLKPMLKSNGAQASMDDQKELMSRLLKVVQLTQWSLIPTNTEEHVTVLGQSVMHLIQEMHKLQSGSPAVSVAGTSSTPVVPTVAQTDPSVVVNSQLSRLSDAQKRDLLRTLRNDCDVMSVDGAGAIGSPGDFEEEDIPVPPAPGGAACPDTCRAQAMTAAKNVLLNSPEGVPVYDRMVSAVDAIRTAYVPLFPRRRVIALRGLARPWEAIPEDMSEYIGSNVNMNHNAFCAWSDTGLVSYLQTRSDVDLNLILERLLFLVPVTLLSTSAPVRLLQMMFKTWRLMNDFPVQARVIVLAIAACHNQSGLPLPWVTEDI